MSAENRTNSTFRRTMPNRHDRRREQARQAEQKPKDAVEQKKVANEKVIAEAKERNKEIRERREKAKRAVDAAISLAASGLSSGKLSEKDRARYAWALKAAKEAKAESLDKGADLYTVRVEDKTGKVVMSRKEGMPVEELEYIVEETVARVQKEVKQIETETRVVTESEQAKARYEVKRPSTEEEYKQKEAWYDIFEGLSKDNPLRLEVEMLVSSWEETDRQNAESEGRQFSSYSGEHKRQQFGEALKQICDKHLKNVDKGLNEKLIKKSKRLRGLLEVKKALEENSELYFNYHFKKDSDKLSEEEKNNQHLYTKREANLISQDKEYRNLLLEKFTALKSLPKNFEQMDEQGQDYELAMLALENRRVLNLPTEQEVPAPVYEAVGNRPMPSYPDGYTREVPQEVAVPKTVSLENTNQPYDLENLAMSIPEQKKPIETKLFLVDISEIAKRMAWTKCEEKIQKEYQGMGVFKRVLKGMSENKRRIEYYQQALAEIQNDNNLMRAISERLSGQTMPGVSPRISSEYLSLLDKIVAEYKHDVVDSQRELGDSMNNDPEVQDRFAELLYRYRTNKWDGAAYNGLDKRACVELYVKENIAGYINKQSSAKWTTDVDRLKEAKGLLYASNFYEILDSIDQNYKQQIDLAVKDVMDKNPEANIEAIRAAISKHVEGVQGLNLQLGLKDRDLVNNRPKGILNLVEKWQSWAEGGKVDPETGSLSLLSKPKRVLGKILLNPFVGGVVGGVVGEGVVQGAVKWGVVTGAVAAGASGFWVPLALGAGVGAAFRAIKRGKDIKYDIAQELRQETLGGKGSEVLDGKVKIKIPFKKNGITVRDVGSLRYEGATMQIGDAMAQINALSGKTNFSDVEKQQLASIYARLQLERDLLKDTSKKFAKVDLFNLDEKTGNAVGSNAGAKSDLRIALKNLNITEQQLQSLADAEKGKILDIISGVGTKQEKYRKAEMFIAGTSGAVMGIAGGMIGQQITYGTGRLLGIQYFKTHGTTAEKMLDAVQHSDIYQKYFGGAISAPGIAHGGLATPGISRDRTLAEFMAENKGKIANGEIGEVHTRNFYDNQGNFVEDGSGGITHEPEIGSHVHKLNELKFYISKSASGDLHFKVPIEDGDSWSFHDASGSSEVLDADTAFAEGRIKMIFVPDGSNASEGVILDVDPVTKEVVIPKGSALEKLFDSNGRPKGSGYFGLAEKVGNKFNWINSERNSGLPFDFGQVQEVPTPTPVVGFSEYDTTIPLVPPTRKIYSRKAEEIKKKQEEKSKTAKATHTEKTKAKQHDTGHEKHSTESAKESNNDVGDDDAHEDKKEKKAEEPSYFKAIGKKSEEKIWKKWGHKVHWEFSEEKFAKDNEAKILKTIDSLSEALDSAEKSAVEAVLNKGQGLRVKFQTEGQASLENGVLVLPFEAKTDAITKLFSTEEKVVSKAEPEAKQVDSTTPTEAKSEQAQVESASSSPETLFREKYKNIDVDFKGLDRSKTKYNKISAFRKLSRAMIIIKEEGGFPELFKADKKWQISLIGESESRKKVGNVFEIPYSDKMSSDKLVFAIKDLYNPRERQIRKKASGRAKAA